MYFSELNSMFLKSSNLKVSLEVSAYLALQYIKSALSKGYLSVFRNIYSCASKIRNLSRGLGTRPVGRLVSSITSTEVRVLVCDSVENAKYARKPRLNLL